MEGWTHPQEMQQTGFLVIQSAVLDAAAVGLIDDDVHQVQLCRASNGCTSGASGTQGTLSSWKAW